jgi:hypothetical protein
MVFSRSSELFPAIIDPTVVSWVLMVALPLAMLFLVLDKWQWNHNMTQHTLAPHTSHLLQPALVPVKVPVEVSSAQAQLNTMRLNNPGNHYRY